MSKRGCQAPFHCHSKNMSKAEFFQKNPVYRNEHTFVICNINANPSNPVPQTNSTIISTKRILYSSQSFKRLSLLLYFSELNYVFSYLNVRSVPVNVSSYFWNSAFKSGKSSCRIFFVQTSSHCAQNIISRKIRVGYN